GNQDEDDGGKGMTGNAIAPAIRANSLPAKHEQAGRGEAEEKEVHGDDVVQNLLVASGECNDDGPDTLEHDCGYWNVGTRVYGSNALEKNAVFGHREIDSRCGENGLA